MKYLDIKGREVDTHDALVSHLLTMVRHLSQGSYFARDFVDRNGLDAVARFVAATRARLFRDRESITPTYRAYLNDLSAPRCRCGRRGTRRIGSVTFCATCGPTARALSKQRYVSEHYLRHSREVDEARTQYDKREQARASLRAVKRKH